MATAYVGLGSNLGDRRANLCAALTALADWPDIALHCDRWVASLYESSPVDVDDTHSSYFNTAARIETSLNPHALLRACLVIEEKLGRKRDGTCQPRVIDVDLLLYGDFVVVSNSLTLPHPRLSQRRFVLEPLAEIAADVLHPTSKQTIDQLCNHLRDRIATGPLDQPIKRIQGPAWALACINHTADDNSRA